jgi:hypothetical protein
MKTLSSRILAAALLAVVAWLPSLGCGRVPAHPASPLPPGASVARGSALEPDKLVILSTSDVKGKTDPCG